MDYTDQDDAVLRQIIEDAGQELARRQSERALEQQVADVMQTARDGGVATTPTQGAEWVAPTSVVDAYIAGDTVTHQGKTWTSTITPNTWEPPTMWRLQSDDPDTPADWVRPSSTIDAYVKGDQVTYQGHVYESVWDNPNTWSPTEFPDAWKLIS